MSRSPELMTREELEEEVAYLRGELGMTRNAAVEGILRSAFKIAPSEVTLLLALYRARGKVLSREQLNEAVPPKWSRVEDRASNLISVWVCRLRKKIGSDAIENQWDGKYALTATGIAKVQAALETARVEI